MQDAYAVGETLAEKALGPGGPRLNACTHIHAHAHKLGLGVGQAVPLGGFALAVAGRGRRGGMPWGLPTVQPAHAMGA